MKIKSQTWQRFGVCLITLISSAGLVRAQDLVAKSFDASTDGMGYGWGANATFGWDGALDAETNGASGSLRADVDFSSTGYTVIQGNMAVASFATYDRVRLSVYLDDTATLNGSGNYGSIEVRARPTGWGWPGSAVNMGNITNKGWTHFEKPLPVDMISSSVGLNIAWNGNGYADTRTIWLDQLVFVERAAAPPPPTLTLTKAGPGVEIKTTGGPDYARKNLATAGSLAPSLSWLNSTGAVSYAMTINENLQPIASPGYAANIMLCAGTDTAINTSPDWYQPSGIFLEVLMNTNGFFDVEVRFKTNAPNSHGIRFSGDPTNGYPGLLIQNTNTGLSSLVGTWSLTLSNSTVQLSGPGGLSASAQLPADALSWFGSGNNFWALFGAQPYLQSDRIISLSRVKIQGLGDFSANVDQDFTASSALDANLRVLQEGTGGVVLKPTNTAWRVSWGLPDTGMYLWSAPTIKSNDWTYTGVSAISQGVRRTVFATNVTASAGYFQLRNHGPAAPPYVLESFESASPFPAASSPYFNFEPSTAAGVTEGTNSLHVSYTNDSTWAWRGSIDYGAAAYAEWKTHTKLVFDLHRAAFTAGWNLEMVVALDGTMGWNQNQVVNWAWLNAGTETTQTITWDYSAISGAAPGTGASLKLNLMLHGNGGDANGHCGDVYIDNMRFEN